MASGDTLAIFTPQQAILPSDWRFIAFTSGGTHEVLVADTLTGATSGATAVVQEIVVTSGTWGGGDAAGWFILITQSGTFQSETLNEGANTNVCTIGSDTSVSMAAPAERNNHAVLAFDDTAVETALFSTIMPRVYAGGGVTIYLHYSMASAVADTIDWDVAFERIGDQQQDIDNNGFAAVNSVDNTTVPGTAGNVDIVNVTFTDGADMDSVAVGEGFRLMVRRDAVADDATGDGELHFVEIKET